MSETHKKNNRESSSVASQPVKTKKQDEVVVEEEEDTDEADETVSENSEKSVWPRIVTIFIVLLLIAAIIAWAVVFKQYSDVMTERKNVSALKEEVERSKSETLQIKKEIEATKTEIIEREKELKERETRASLIRKEINEGIVKSQAENERLSELLRKLQELRKKPVSPEPEKKSETVEKKQSGSPTSKVAENELEAKEKPDVSKSETQPTSDDAPKEETKKADSP